MRIHILVRGRVQGVFFRSSAAKEARRLRLRGWVRNLPTGEVEAVAEGESDAVDAFVAWCRRGPPLAEVTEVELRQEQDRSALTDFQVVHGVEHTS